MYQGSEGQSLYCACPTTTGICVRGMEPTRGCSCKLSWTSSKISCSFRTWWLQDYIFLGPGLSSRLGESSRMTSPCTVHSLVSLPQDSLPSSQHSIPTCHYPSCLHWATRPQPQVCNPESNHRRLQVLFLPTNIRTWNHLPGPVVEINNPSTFREAALPVIQVMQPPVVSYMLWKQRDVFYSHRAHSHFIVYWDKAPSSFTMAPFTDTQHVIVPG